MITLTAVQDLMYDRFEVEKTLVIAPLRVAEDTWSREADKWDHLRSLRISKVLGSAKTRIRALHADADLYVINRENVVWLVRYLKSRKEPWPFDMVVIDELSSFKSSQAQRFKALRKIRPHVKRIVGLTGTPAANSLMDLWAEIGILDAGERLGRFIGRYRETYFRPAFVSPSGVVYKYTPRPGALEAITERISDITISLKASDYLELPDEIDSVIGVELPGQAKEAYRKMERDALLELEDRQITALNAAAVVSKLTQISNGFIYDGDGRASRIHDAKTDALKELIEQADGPVLVFYEFREDAEHLLRQIDGAVMLAGEVEIMQWNAGRIPVLLAHPASVGYGLNLQDGGHIIVWYGLTWSLELYQQANARLYRQGQQKPVIIHHILAAGTIDEQVMAALRHKDTSQAALLAALKERRDADAQDLA